MALYSVKYPVSVDVNMLYARSPEDIVDIIEQFQKPEYDLPKPISTSVYPNEPSTIEKIDHATLLFDYNGKFNPHRKPLEFKLASDFTVQIRQESLDIFVASQPYFNEATVGNLAIVHYKYNPTTFVYLPEDIAQELSTLDVSREFAQQQKESRQLIAKNLSHAFPLMPEMGVGGYRN